MTTAADQAVSKGTESVLQFKKALLPIDKYAAREGLSKEIVEECAKLGIIRIRKCGGRSFVVDVPLSPYRCTSEATEELRLPTDRAVQQKEISRPAEQASPDVSGKGESLQPGRNIDPVEIILEAVREELSESAEVIDTAAVADSEILDVEGISESIDTSEPQEIEIIDDLPEFTSELAEIEEISGPVPAVQNDSVQLGILAEQARSRRLWQIAAVFSFVFLFASVFAVLWFYMDRKIQLDRLDSAYTSIQKVYNDLKQANLYTETLQSGLDDSRVEVERVRGELSGLKAKAKLAQNESGSFHAGAERLQNELNDFKAKALRLENELNDSKAELKTAQNELARAREELDAVQQYNSRAVEKLNEQVRDLTGRLTELAESY